MGIEAGLRSFLLADPAIVALVGARIRPWGMGKTDAFPRVRYHRVDGPRLRTLKGQRGVVHPRFQLDCEAETYTEARDVADAIRDRVDPNDGTPFSGLMGDVWVQSIRVESDPDNYDPPADVSAIGVHTVPLDVVIWYEES